MNKEARLLCLLLVTAASVVLAGCSRKPAYSEMDPNKPAANQNQNQNQNQNAGDQSATSTPPVTEPPATDAAQPAPANPAGALKSPRFFDQATGGIRDLPAYPNANRISVQVGPVQGMNTMSLAFTTSDPMDKISAFFERVTKDNKWTVTHKVIDPEFSEWNLKKGPDDSGKVQVKMDQITRVLTIVMVRTEKEVPGK